MIDVENDEFEGFDNRIEEEYLTSLKCDPKPLERGFSDEWTWSEKSRDDDVVYFRDRKTIVFHPSWSRGTAGAHGTKLLNNGRYYWELKYAPRIFGTSIMCGIGTKKASVHKDAFVNLLGQDSHSWGLNHNGRIHHNGISKKFTRGFSENKATLIGVLFDGINGTLSYYKDGEFLGVAFHDLEKIKEPLYPMASSTAAKSEMTICCCRREFVNLQDRCRYTLLKYLGDKNNVNQLNLPLSLKQYLMS